MGHLEVRAPSERAGSKTASHQKSPGSPGAREGAVEEVTGQSRLLFAQVILAKSLKANTSGLTAV